MLRIETRSCAWRIVSEQRPVSNADESNDGSVPSLVGSSADESVSSTRFNGSDDILEEALSGAESLSSAAPQTTDP